MGEKLDYIVKSLNKTTSKRFERFIVNAIYNRLDNNDLEFQTQMLLNVDGTYRYIDMYFPDLKVGVEIDEWMVSNGISALRKNELYTKERELYKNVIAEYHKNIMLLKLFIYDTDEIESVFKGVNDIVSRINEILALKMDKPKWIFDSNKRLEEISNRGYLKRGDIFSSKEEILKLFGRTLDSDNETLFGPKSSAIWIDDFCYDSYFLPNRIGMDLSEIYQDIDLDKKSRIDVEWDITYKAKRYIFYCYQENDVSFIRFLGVYEASFFDDKTQEEVWKLSTEELLVYPI